MLQIKYASILFNMKKNMYSFIIRLINVKHDEILEKDSIKSIHHRIINSRNDCIMHAYKNIDIILFSSIQ